MQRLFDFDDSKKTMSRRGASPFSVAQRPLRAGRATKPARFYDEVRDREGARRRNRTHQEERPEREKKKAREFFFFFFAGPFSAQSALSCFLQKSNRPHPPRLLLAPPIPTTHQQEDRLAPVTRVELGKLKVRRLFSEESGSENQERKKQREIEPSSTAEEAKVVGRRRQGAR